MSSASEARIFDALHAALNHVPVEAIPEAVGELERAKTALLARLLAIPATRCHDVQSETWREKLWTVPADTRLGVRECAEALGKKTSWVYHQQDLPRRKLGSELTFLAGELRDWLSTTEEVVLRSVARVLPVQRKPRSS
jgi:predicted DNA-binding transcriptional regulator AlpA